MRSCFTLNLLLTTILFGVHFSTCAQTTYLDSLNDVFINTIEDSTKIKVLFLKTSNYRYVNPDSAIHWMKKASVLARKNNLEKKHAQATYQIGVGFHIKGALDSAVQYYEHALPQLITTKDSSGISSVTNNIGLIKLNRGNYTEAIKHLRQSSLIDKKLGDLPGQASSLNNIGLIYRSMNDYANALAYFFKSEKIQIQLKNDFRLVQLYNNIGMVKELEKQFDSAKYYYKKSLLKAYAPDSKCHRANAFIGLGKIYYVNKQIDSSAYYANSAILVSSECQNPKILAIAKLLKGQVEIEHKKYPLAEKLITEAYNLALNHELKPEIEQAAFRFHQLYKKTRNYKKALQFFELYEKTKTEIFNEEKVREVTRLEENHKAEQKRQQLIANQETEKLKLREEKEDQQFQKKIILLVSLLLLLLAISISRGYFINKKNNQKLSVLNGELHLKNDKLNKLDEYRIRFLSNINHDIRTPLTLIKGRLDQIKKDDNNFLTEKSEQNLNQIAENVDTLHQMSEEIQNLGNIEEGKIEIKWESVIFTELTEAIVYLFSSRAEIEEKDLKVIKNASKHKTIHLDTGHYQRILTNILSNAFKFTQKGDAITIIIEEGDAYAKVTISDTGFGISPKDKPHIFDRFYQSVANAHSLKEGFGIGLTLVKELISAHRGQINFDSKFEQGSQFEVMLPYNLDKIAINKKTIEQPQIKTDKSQNVYQKVDLESSEKPTILIVEDHKAVRDYLVEVISPRYCVKQAGQGKQALEILQKENIDLIITDLMMPWMDGFELIEALNKSSFKDIPIMVVSARTSDDDKKKVLGLGVNNFLSKPFNEEELHQRISNMLSNTESSNSLKLIRKNTKLKNNIEKDILDKVHKLVLERISDPNLNIDVLADLLCASNRKVNTLIKGLTGKPPKSYIKTIRLEYAQQLINNKRVKTLVEAANAIGMKNGTEFKLQYQKQFGETPFK